MEHTENLLKHVCNPFLYICDFPCVNIEVTVGLRSPAAGDQANHQLKKKKKNAVFHFKLINRNTIKDLALDI